MAQRNMQDGLPGREFDVVIKLNADTMSGMMRSCGSMLEQWNRLNADTMKFCAARWKEDLEVPTRLARSQAPGDIAEVYAGFARRMLDDYSDQTRRVMDFVGTMGREAVMAEADADDVAGEAPVVKGPAEKAAPAKEAGPKAEAGAETVKAQATVEPVEKPAEPARPAAAKQDVKAEAEPVEARPAPKSGASAKAAANPDAGTVEAKRKPAARPASVETEVKTEAANGAAKPKAARTTVKKAQ